MTPTTAAPTCPTTVRAQFEQQVHRVRLGLSWSARPVSRMSRTTNRRYRDCIRSVAEHESAILGRGLHHDGGDAEGCIVQGDAQGIGEEWPATPRGSPLNDTSHTSLILLQTSLMRAPIMADAWTEARFQNLVRRFCPTFRCIPSRNNCPLKLCPLKLCPLKLCPFGTVSI